MRFCFYALLQEDLVNITKYWNNYKIKKSHGAKSQDFFPKLIYCLPEDYGDNDGQTASEPVRL